MNKICRICLEEGVLTSIFTKNFNLSLCDMIEYCSNVKISKCDGLPEQLCSNCIYKLGIAYHFKQTSESADVRLRQYLGLRIPNKYTDASVMTEPIITHQTIIKRCKCKAESRKSSSNYKKKLESEKLKRGPKPKPKQVHACYHCDKQFRCQAQLEMHVRTHTGDKPFACAFCPRRFTQKHNLTIHLRIHTGEKPFQCEVCSKRFSAPGNLHVHLKIHTGQKYHTCSLCSKCFTTSSELTRHMSKHKGVKNFKCDMCAKAYIHSRSLKIHKMKKHHIVQQNLKSQNEGGFNNSSSIDIIGIDVGKDIPLCAKDVNVNQLVPDKSQNVNLHPVMGYEQKQNGIKDIFYSLRTINESHTCTICGEAFTFITALAQHYVHVHKGCEPSLGKQLVYHRS